MCLGYKPSIEQTLHHDIYIVTIIITVAITIIFITVDVKCGPSSPESESESLPPNISEVREFLEFALWKLLRVDPN